MFQFDGSFSGAFREIPLRDGESLDQVAVSEGDVAYRPGACAELGCSGQPGTFGTTRTDKGVRIVWHYQAQSEPRRFRIHYRLRGVATAYDDVVDVNVKVWGDEWEVGLGQLTATLVGAGRDRPRLGPSRRRARRRDHRRQSCQSAGARHSGRPVRRAARARPAPGLHLDRGDEGRERPGPREDRGRGARGCGGVRARPAEDRRGARQPAANDRAASPRSRSARHSP